MSALEVQHLTVAFAGAGQPAVEDVSFALEAGQIAMVIGPNGAGKTTLLRAILGFVPATGVVRICNQSLPAAYPLVGYVPQHFRFDTTLPLTGRELLRLSRRAMTTAMTGASLPWAIDTFQLAAFLDQPLGTLSGGQLKRLLLARAMLRRPRVLLLDEPEAGVDVGGEQSLYQLLEHLVATEGLMALINSHELNIVLRVATQVICLNRQLLGIGSPTQMLTPQTLFHLYGPTAALYQHVHSRPG
jgi:ABC-type Mn2+/Zn2+ transport system ATPase subunit